MLTEKESQFLETRRVARLATANFQCQPHVVPVCFTLHGNTAYITVDKKPKQNTNRILKRIRNIRENPQVALVADHYDDTDWSQLGWVMLQGRAEILENGVEHDHAQELLKQRYPQYEAMVLNDLPVIAIRILKVASWGNLSG